MTVAHKNAGLNIIADRRLAFDLRLRPFGDRHLSGLLPSPRLILGQVVSVLVSTQTSARV